MTDPQQQLGKVILVIFVAFLALDLAPRFLTPIDQVPELPKDQPNPTEEKSAESHSETSYSRSSSHTPEQESPQEVKENYNAGSYYTTESKEQSEDNLGHKSRLNVLNVQYCTS